jgi:type IV pilus assembly protein PilW
MSSPLPFRTVRRSMRGLSVIELMVGMAVGLVATVVVAQVLSFSEGQKRSTTSGGDAQISGALALYTMQRDIEAAGYGFASTPDILGCTITAKYNGANAVGWPTTLAPVVITQGASGAPDSISVLASSNPTYSVPTRVLAPGYVATDRTSGGKAFSFPVQSTLGIKQGDLLLAAMPGAAGCGAFQATADAAAGFVPRADATTTWNPDNQPAGSYGDGAVLVNFGQVTFHSYAVNASGVLQQTSLSTATNNTATTDLQSNVVTVQALYGKDTDANDIIDQFDTTTPTTTAEWQQLRAVRIAVVTRSAQWEKDEVTTANPSWDVGSALTVSGAVTCGTSKCLTLKVDAAADWKHYRYKIFDTVVPLRNMVWKS